MNEKKKEVGWADIRHSDEKANMVSMEFDIL